MAVALGGVAGCNAGADDAAATDSAPTTGAGSDSTAAMTGAADSTTGGGGPGTDDVGPTGDADADDDSGTGPGAQWVPTHEVGQDVGRFLSVWAAGADPSVDPVYVVGGQVDPDVPLNAGAMVRWDGAAWTDAPLPADTPTLNWVFGVSDGVTDRRVTVGDLGTVLWRDGDDGAWTAGSCATVLPLWGVWGATPDALWAVGGDGFNKDPVLCHFDGVAWAKVDIPTPSIATHALFKIWGTSADNVFAVGDLGYILHFDGADWVEQPSGTESDLISLWGRAPDEILAVGGRSEGVLSRWDGAAWTSVQVGTAGLNGVWMDPNGDAVVAGAFGTLGRVASGTMDVVPDDAGTLLSLHAVFGTTQSLADGPLFAVGGSLDMPPPYVGLILAWPG